MKVLIAGLGLIGGSFALALRDHGIAEEILGAEGSEEHAAEAERLRRYIIRYDTIRPAHPELPYGQGKEGFKAPAERRVTKP